MLYFLAALFLKLLLTLVCTAIFAYALYHLDHEGDR